MIKCIDSPPIPAATKTIRVSLFADTKNEVTDDISQMEIVDFPDGYDIDMASTVSTADGHFANRKSDGTWYWIA